MSQSEETHNSPDREMIEWVWAEARDLVRRLEGTSVQRFAVAVALVLGILSLSLWR